MNDRRPLSRRAIRAVLRRLPTRVNRFLGWRWEPLYWRRFLRTRGMEWPWDYEARLDPAAPLAESLILDRLDELPDPLSVLDVGAGPLTDLGKVIAGRRLELTPTDALGGEYRRLLAREGVTAPVPTLDCAGEDLLEHFGPDRFDVAYSRNALDHAADPARIIENMLAVTRPGGYVLLKHLRREGERRDYTMLHSWNFDIEDGAPVLFDPRTRVDLRRAFGDQARVEAFHHNEWVYVVMRRLPVMSEHRRVYSTSDGDLRRARPADRVRARETTGPVKVRRETAGRRGKPVTTVSNLPLDDAETKALAGRLKKRCGVGGSAKGGVIELQGDQREAVLEVLRAEGYVAVLAGG